MGNCTSSSQNRMSGGMGRVYMPDRMQAYRRSSSETMQNRSENCTSEEFPIGMAYVPWQKWREIYEPDKAFRVGTIFAELDKPFLGMRGVRK